MSSLNRCTFIGNLGRDPEMKTTQDGKTVATFSIACTEKWKDGEHTEWVNIVAWEKLADLAGQYLSKGRQVYVEGKLRTRPWEKDGQKHYRTEVIASNIVFLGNKPESPTNPNYGTTEPGDDGLIPF